MDPKMRATASRALLMGAGILLGGLLWVVGIANSEPNSLGVTEESWTLLIGRFIVIICVVGLAISAIQAARLMRMRDRN